MCLARPWDTNEKKKKKTLALYLKSLKYCGGRRHRNQQLEHRCTIPYGNLWGEFGIEILWPLKGQCDWGSTHRWPSALACRGQSLLRLVLATAFFSTLKRWMEKLLIPSFLTHPEISGQHPIIKHIHASAAKLKFLQQKKGKIMNIHIKWYKDRLEIVLYQQTRFCCQMAYEEKFDFSRALEFGILGKGRWPVQAKSQQRWGACVTGEGRWNALFNLGELRQLPRRRVGKPEHQVGSRRAWEPAWVEGTTLTSASWQGQGMEPDRDRGVGGEAGRPSLATGTSGGLSAERTPSGHAPERIVWQFHGWWSWGGAGGRNMSGSQGRPHRRGCCTQVTFMRQNPGLRHRSEVRDHKGKVKCAETPMFFCLL